VKYVSRMDVLRSILRTLNRRKEPEGGIRHGENLTQEQTDEYLGLLLRNNLVTLEESGLYNITPGGRALLEKWNRTDSAIAEGRNEGASPRQGLDEPVEAAGRSGVKPAVRREVQH
jgi:predicted transcriptional regulator